MPSSHKTGNAISKGPFDSFYLVEMYNIHNIGQIFQGLTMYFTHLEKWLFPESATYLIALELILTF
jgi:hypothetical protein